MISAAHIIDSRLLKWYKPFFLIAEEWPSG